MRYRKFTTAASSPAPWLDASTLRLPWTTTTASDRGERLPLSNTLTLTCTSERGTQEVINVYRILQLKNTHLGPIKGIYNTLREPGLFAFLVYWSLFVFLPNLHPETHEICLDWHVLNNYGANLLLSEAFFIILLKC